MKQEIKDYECKYCHKHFNVTRGELSNHMHYCKDNPLYEQNIKANKERGKMLHDKNENDKKIYTFICPKCKNEFSLKLSEAEYKSGRHRKHCSLSCANSRIHSDETKQKIGTGIRTSKAYQEKIKMRKQKTYLKYLEEQKETSRKKIYMEKFVCGSKEYDDIYPEISKHRQLSWFRNLIPFGLNYDTVGTHELINEYFKVKALLYDEYINNSLSPKDIWIKYNCADYINHSETILHMLKGMGIKTRNQSDANINSYLHGKLGKSNKPNQYKQNWHTTWEGKQVYLRSSYEEDYACELDKKRIKYDVEFKRIKYWDPKKNKYKCTIPDFYLSDFNTIVEIKSLYTLDIENLRYRFDEYKRLGYNVKLIVDHIEVDLYSLDKDKKYKVHNGELVDAKNKVYTPRRVNSHWISNLTLKCSMRCNEEDMNTFLNDGWVIGRKFNFN